MQRKRERNREREQHYKKNITMRILISFFAYAYVYANHTLDWQSSPVLDLRDLNLYIETSFSFVSLFHFFNDVFSLSLSSFYFVSFIFWFSKACNSLFQSEFWLYSILDAYKNVKDECYIWILLCFELYEYKLRIVYSLTRNINSFDSIILSWL